MYLSKDEVDALPDGTLVKVTWSGGNGPHIYKMDTDRFGNRLIVSSRPDGGLREYVNGSFIYPKKPGTLVEVAPV